MIAFLRSLWRFARPYKSRLVLGLACGVCYAMANAMLVLVIKLVVDLVFPGAAQSANSPQVQRTTDFLRPLLETFSHSMSVIQSPTSKTGIALVICTIPT